MASSKGIKFSFLCVFVCLVEHCFFFFFGEAELHNVALQKAGRMIFFDTLIFVEPNSF